MYINSQPTEGDIAFIAYTRETFTAADIWDDFSSRASQDKPFFIFYCALLGALILALVVTLAWRPKTPPPAPNSELQPPQHDDEGRV